jgi:hypothetical protein
MELGTLVDAALDDDEYYRLKHSGSLLQVREGTKQALIELTDVYVPSGRPEIRDPEPAVAAQWRKRFLVAVEHLRHEGMKVCADLEFGADHYVELRKQWDPYVMGLARYMEFESQDVDPIGAHPEEASEHREMPSEPIFSTPGP